MPDLDFPTITQYASPDLIAAIAYEGLDPATDVRWTESGASTHGEYARWCRHMCGIACLAMVLHARDGKAPALFELLDGARTYGAYTENDEGQIKGLIYDPAAVYARAVHGLDAQVHRELPLDQLTAALDTGQLVIASVHKEIRRPERPAPGKGGHLVLATGHHDGQITFRNPSGHSATAREATLPAEVFSEFYGQRGISIALTT